ncbi:hypothetical protein [Roseiflexus castenholzii]|uniref:hypothetical protein n=1 Tax=Roseiflexus castenholzii TaxID=120962 RepID=UPI00059B83D5|nr:hypothetical protein [Roseiflexus castenholzii]
MTDCFDRLRRWRSDEVASTGCAGLAMTACFDRLRRWRSDRASRHVCEGIASPPAAARNDRLLRPAAPVAQ